MISHVVFEDDGRRGGVDALAALGGREPAGTQALLSLDSRQTLILIVDRNAQGAREVLAEAPSTLRIGAKFPLHR